MSVNLSVIVPVYKVEPYIRQCLDSLINQTYRDMEIIVIDDGSPDNCGAICDEYATKHSQMRVIHQQNAGVAAARNRGMSMACGKWITFMDSDDWCDADYYERLFERMANREFDIFEAGGFLEERTNASRYGVHWETDFATSDHVELRRLTARVIAPPSQKEWRNRKTGKRTFVPDNNGAPWDKLYRADFLKEKNLLFDTSHAVSEDTLFNYLAFRQASSVGGCTVIGYHYRQLPISNAHGYRAEMPDTRYWYVEQYYRYALETPENAELLDAVWARAVYNMRNTINDGYLSPNYPGTLKDAEREIRAMTRRPLYREALRRDASSRLSEKMLIMKRFLRLPTAWPLIVAHGLNNLKKCVYGLSS